MNSQVWTWNSYLVFLSPQKPGKWCAMHVHIAWQIYHHQQKVKVRFAYITWFDCYRTLQSGSTLHMQRNVFVPLLFLLFVNSGLQNTIQPFLFLRYFVRGITFLLFCTWPSPAADAGWPTQAGLWPQTRVPKSTPRPHLFWSYPSRSWPGTTCIAFLSSRWADDQNPKISIGLYFLTEVSHWSLSLYRSRAELAKSFG